MNTKWSNKQQTHDDKQSMTKNEAKWQRKDALLMSEFEIWETRFSADAYNFWIKENMSASASTDVFPL